MRRLRVAVIGLGRLGKACAEALLDADTLNLAGIVRRRASIGRSRAAGLLAGADTLACGAAQFAATQEMAPLKRGLQVTDSLHGKLRLGLKPKRAVIRGDKCCSLSLAHRVAVCLPGKVAITSA